jgi:hypothetical protein
VRRIIARHGAQFAHRRFKETSDFARTFVSAESGGKGALWEPPALNFPRRVIESQLPPEFMSSAVRIAWVRDPDSRQLSKFNHVHVSNLGIPATEHNKLQILRNIDDPYATVFCAEGESDRYQNACCNGDAWDENKAFENIDFAGVTELFDESVVLLLLQLQGQGNPHGLSIGDVLFSGSKISGGFVDAGTLLARHPRLEAESAGVKEFVSQPEHHSSWDHKFHRAATRRVLEATRALGSAFNVTLRSFRCFNAAAALYCTDPELTTRLPAAAALLNFYKLLGTSYWSDNGMLHECYDEFWESWQSREDELCAVGAAGGAGVSPAVKGELRQHGTAVTARVILQVSQQVAMELDHRKRAGPPSEVKSIASISCERRTRQIEKARDKEMEHFQFKGEPAPVHAPECAALAAVEPGSALVAALAALRGVLRASSTPAPAPGSGCAACTAQQCAAESCGRGAPYVCLAGAAKGGCR